MMQDDAMPSSVRPTQAHAVALTARVAYPQRPPVRAYPADPPGKHERLGATGARVDPGVAQVAGIGREFT